MNKNKRVDMLLNEFKIARTVNEAIDRIFIREVKNDKAISRGPRFYCHLNKLVSNMEKNHLIRCVDTKIGPTNRLEKIWRINE